MSTFGLIGSAYFLIPLIITAVVWIWINEKNRRLELTFLAVVIIGGEVLDEGLRLLFHRPGPIGSSLPFTFPSEQSFISLSIYGFAAYLLFRHSGSAIARISAILIVIVMCLAVGVSRIYFDIQYPSDVAAGYAFGGTWLSLNVIVLEILRMIRNDK
ncbi:phosphatase PAP2 family protein [Cohnella kolymensis]|uniref:phosphatase PAP2 family protein n=1 Tax=Cohnella kolymensis TaxID=1590652 RepID=UPI0013791D53|nr:phosphatase PAP2 family protein [Cohnella kolymensis]